MRILLLTDIPPCTNFTAGIVLDQLCRMLPRDSVACFAVISPSIIPEISPPLRDVPVRYYSRPREEWNFHLPSRLSAFSSGVSLLMEAYHGGVKVRRIASRAAQFGLEFGAEAVWCILEGQTMIRLAVPVARALGVPLFTEVWDPPEWWLRVRGVDRFSRRRILREFDRALRRSSGCAMASPAMAERYHRDHGVRAVSFLPSLDPRMAVSPAEAVHSSGELVIGLAGQLYADREWNALVAALDSVRWSLCGRDVRIRLLGRYAGLKADGPIRLEFLGWHAQAEVVRLLSEADILYCPYWFDAAFRKEAELSFPSKLTTYLAAGRPVLFHGPEYASPARFIEEHKAGVCCYSLEPEEIVRTLTKLVSDQALYAQTARAGREAFDKCLTLARLRESFASLFSIRSDDLLPLGRNGNEEGIF